MGTAVQQDGKSFMDAGKGLYVDDDDVLYYMDGDGDMHPLPTKEEEAVDLPVGLKDVPVDILDLAANMAPDAMLVHYVRRPAPKDRIRAVVANLGGKSNTVLCLGEPTGCSGGLFRGRSGRRNG
jgi:hypothetical protein